MIRRVAMIIGVIVLVGVSLRACTPAPSEDERLLNVNAGRYTQSLAITSNEPVTLSRCDVRLLDRDGGDWEAAIPEDIAPSATVRVPWNRFTRAGQPMPSYMPAQQRDILVSCLVGGGASPERRSVAIRFGG